MEKRSTTRPARARQANEFPQDSTVLIHAWYDYERTGLPLECSQREHLIAQQAYLQGARALFGILCTLITITADTSLAQILEYLGEELGIDERPSRPS